jgi:hypothetical protein
MKRYPENNVHPNKREFQDADYLDKLSKKDREWYENFLKAEYGASHEAAKKIKGSELTKIEKRRLNAQNNRRVRDAYNRLDRRLTASRRQTASEIQGRKAEEHEE